MEGAGMARSKAEEGEKSDEAKANNGVLKEDAETEKKEEFVSEDMKKEEREEEEKGWVAEGVPFVGVREQWNSSMFDCLGGDDNEFLSSDLEVCLLGAFAPCMLYASNVERMRSGGYLGSCTAYALLYFLGYSFYGSNCLAPCITYPSRTEIRRQFNLEGSCSALIRSGCCTSCIEDEEHLEEWDVRCDHASHFFCHNFTLCQEGRELRRRLPHPGFYGRSMLVMSPPSNQAMARGP
ncbi:cell number regulator 8 [Amborella trichopoda]|uniref:PLAC8 family protein n=1 Tax=Amborella trichopoda TaxID=13333 RepID=W1NKP1_AMBTC|nr:cell number regulator 8 [Amborella trichopoda]ERM95750.1 hypothetical protein AMTR_s00023p00246550 [Amborella trichopoda]|eukprot:XP_006828334.1 cell number regulator 8 [Amborella trichopoda]